MVALEILNQMNLWDVGHQTTAIHLKSRIASGAPLALRVRVKLHATQTAVSTWSQSNVLLQITAFARGSHL